MFNKKFVYFILLFFLLVYPFKVLAAEELKVSASVDKTKVSLDEFIQFKISIEGIGDSYKNPKIKLSQLEDNFAVIGTSQSNSISLKGNKVNISWQIQYTLLPKREGEIKIGSAEVAYEGKNYKTDEILITVTASTKPKKVPQEKIPSKKVPWSREEGIFI